MPEHPLELPPASEVGRRRGTRGWDYVDVAEPEGVAA
jgi:hypothetical protein